MREIDVDVYTGKTDDEGNKIFGKQKEKIYEIKELPYLGKLLKCKESKKGKIRYLEIPCAFDIEATNIYKRDSNGDIITDPRPFAFMYQWQFCLDDCVCFGRTWEEFMELMRALERNMNLSLNVRLVVYIHNFTYEWSFIRKFIDYSEGFFKDEGKPLKVVTTGGIEFRDSYALSNMALIKFCENERNVIHYKLVDTYDYEKIRTAFTPLTMEEEAYCYNDVRGLCECIRSRMMDNTLARIPLTSTGYVRRDLRESVRGNKKYRENFKNNALDIITYPLCRSAFRGGDTHANLDHTNQIIYDVTSMDITSSYPSSMLLNDNYPVTAFHPIKLSTFLNLDMSERALLIEIAFFELKYVGDCGIPYIAHAKCIAYSSDHVFDNGRILYAKSCSMIITNVDLEIIKKEYTAEDVRIGRIYSAMAGSLDENIKKVVLSYYEQKTLLKSDNSKIYEYNKMKNSLNSTYGCMVMRIDQTEVTYNPTDDTYFTNEKPLEDILGEFYKSRNNFLSYQHGLWITANSRMRLRKMLWKVGKDVCYCDTDSIKYIGDHKADFDNENNNIIKEAIAKGAYAYDAKGNIKYMGVWDFDGFYTRFCTLGAKKYIYEAKNDDGKLELHTTIAGVNKKKGQKFFTENGMESFKIGTKIVNSGHLTAFYNDDDIHYITIDHCKMLTASNVALVDNSYKIGVTNEYLDLLEKALDNQCDLDYI